MIPSSLESMMGRRVLLLSPHADDVAYSIGGIVARLFMQADILMITVFGRSGWTLPDIPYSAGLPLAGLNRQLTAQGLTPAVTADIGAVLEGKCEDMRGYRSQTSESTIVKMLLHAGRVGMSNARYAERLWCRLNCRTQERRCSDRIDSRNGWIRATIGRISQPPASIRSSYSP